MFSADILICMASEDDSSSKQPNHLDNVEKAEVLDKGME